MGDRGQVKIGEVYLYTHWGAIDLIADVRRALAKRWRWDDCEYLAKIIFDEMRGKDDFGTETGFGIGTTKHGDIWRLIEIKENNKIVVEDNDKVVFEGTFEEFLDWKQKEKE